jgi:hypothetical protein
MMIVNGKIPIEHNYQKIHLHIYQQAFSFETSSKLFEFSLPSFHTDRL